MNYEIYTTVDWLMFFYIYCFLGWCFESTYVSLHQKKWVNRGFMRGPFLPLYGSGAVIMLFVTIPVRDNIFLTFLFGAIGATNPGILYRSCHGSTLQGPLLGLQ